MRRLLPLLAAALVAGCGSPSTSDDDRGTAAATGSSGFTLAPVADGFEQPNDVLSRPGDDGALYVVEQPGRVRVLRDGATDATPFLDLTSVITSGGERGLLGVEFPRDHERSGLLYAHYSAREPEGDTRVVELRVPAGGGTVGPDDITRTLLEVDQPYPNHNGGQLRFGPDGRLYVGLGDGGSGFDPLQSGQDLDGTRLAKLLARDLRRADGDWETVAYGLRNPWRFSWDSETGDLLIGDVGQEEIEEVDLIPAGTTEVVNFGWSAYEGRNRVEGREPDGEVTFPIATYTHDDGCSITGGYVYRGRAIAGLRGRYLYGDFCSGVLFSLRVRDGRATEVRREPVTIPQLTSFGQAADGELYATTVDGAVSRLVPDR